MIKVLFLIEELGGGGKERRLVECLKGLLNKNKFILFLAINKNSTINYDIGLTNLKLFKIDNTNNIILISSYSKLFRYLKPDIVHAWSYKSAFYSSLLKPFFGYKLISGFVADIFGFKYLYGFVAHNFIFRSSEIIISNSREGLRAYNISSKKSRVVYNGFDFYRNRVLNKNLKSELEIKTDLVVTMIGNVNDNKDYKSFIEVAKKIIKLRDDVTFLSIGHVSTNQSALVEPFLNNKHNKIKFLGFRMDIENIIAFTDIGLLCTYSEGISNSIMEFMANEIPVVTTDLIGGSKEIIENNHSGFICSNENLEVTINMLLNDPDKRKKLGLRGRQIIENNFSISQMIKSYEDIYNSIF